jgi:hypothetical protein
VAPQPGKERVGKSSGENLERLLELTKDIELRLPRELESLCGLGNSMYVISRSGRWLRQSQDAIIATCAVDVQPFHN